MAHTPVLRSLILMLVALLGICGTTHAQMSSRHLDIVFVAQELTLDNYIRIGEVYVDHYFVCYVRERVKRTSLDPDPLLTDGSYTVSVTKAGDALSSVSFAGDTRDSQRTGATNNVDVDLLLTDDKQGAMSSNATALDTRVIKMFGANEQTPLPDGETRFRLDVASWIDGRVYTYRARPNLKENATDITDNGNYVTPSLTPGLRLVGDAADPFSWVTNGEETVRFSLPVGVTVLRVEYATKAVNGNTSPPQETTNDVFLASELNGKFTDDLKSPFDERGAKIHRMVFHHDEINIGENSLSHNDKTSNFLLSLKQVSVSYFMPFASVSWKAPDGSKRTVQCIQPIGKANIGGNTPGFVADKFLIRWEGHGFQDSDRLRVQLKDEAGTTHKLGVKVGDSVVPIGSPEAEGVDLNEPQNLAELDVPIDHNVGDGTRGFVTVSVPASIKSFQVLFSPGSSAPVSQ